MNKTLKQILIFVAIASLSSCGKYCAECTEHDSGYTASNFCGTSSEVNIYIEELESTNYQNWSCTKTRD